MAKVIIRPDTNNMVVVIGDIAEFVTNYGPWGTAIQYQAFPPMYLAYDNTLPCPFEVYDIPVGQIPDFAPSWYSYDPDTGFFTLMSDYNPMTEDLLRVENALERNAIIEGVARMHRKYADFHYDFNQFINSNFGINNLNVAIFKLINDPYFT